MLKEASYSLRSALKTPGLSLTVILTLAICISATAAVGNLVNGYFQRLPIPDAKRVVGIFTGGPASGLYGRTSYPDYRDYATASQTLQEIAGSASFGSSLDSQGRTDWVWGAVVTGNYFDALRIRPAMGRFFAPEEQAIGGPAVIVLSHRYWKSRFRGDPKILDQEVRLNRRTFTVIGIAPPSYVGLNAFHHPDLWTPIHQSAALIRNGAGLLEDRNRALLTLIGRLQPGVTRRAALQELSTLGDQIERQDSRGEDPRILSVLPAYHAPPTAREWYLPTSRMLLIAVAFLLLIGCFNVANLLYTKALARRQELATRLALGGTRWSLVRLLLFEVFYLTSLAGTLALLSTGWTGRRLSAYFAPPVQGEMGDAPLFQPDLRVVAFVALLVCAVTIIVAVIPAFRISRTTIVSAMKGGRNAPRARRWLATGPILLVLQIALSLGLLTSTALVWRSMTNILEGDPGYSLDEVFLASVRIPTDRYPTPEEGARFYRDLITGVQEIGGINEVSVAAVAPLSGYSQSERIRIPDFSEEPLEVDRNIVGPRYFATLGIDFVEGESFGPEHDRTTHRVAVINETLAQRYFPGKQSVVGQELIIQETPFTILGMVQDTKYLSLQEDPRALVYFSFIQRFTPNLTLVGRSPQPIESLAPQIRGIVRDLEVEAAVPSVASLRQWLEVSIWEPRLRTDVLRVIGFIGLLLAGVGVFGLMRFRVLTELKEIGVRLAVGASRSRILLLVLKRSAWIGGLGLLLGLPFVYLAGRVMKSYLYGVEPSDLGMLLAIAGILSLVILLAAFFPGFRASRLDPLKVIRYD